MNGEVLIESLIGNDILEESTDTGNLSISHEFRSQRDDINAEITSATGTTESATINDLFDVNITSPTTRNELVATYRALQESGISASREEMVYGTILTTQILRDLPPVSGVPQDFFPIDGDMMNLARNVLEEAIVYVWKNDCPPCDTMRTEFDKLTDQYNFKDTGLLAVYGPDWIEMLESTFDVTGGPTTLFFVNGTVDLRFEGAPTRTQLATEMRKMASKK